MDSLRTALAGGAPQRAIDLPPAVAAIARSPAPARPAAPSCSVYFAWDQMIPNEFEWEAPVVKVGDMVARPAAPEPAAREATPAPASPRAPADAAPVLPRFVLPPTAGPGHARIRERYYTIRFPGAPSIGAGANVSNVIKVARLYFEDGDGARAVELLDCAAAALPEEERLPLAALEILFLTRQGEAFVDAARAFHERFPASTHWSAIERLGWRFAPRERLFAGGRPQGTATDDHFGAWPESPNWIEAPWDLTNEVLAVELRGRVLGTMTS